MSNEHADKASEIHVDADWKAEVQAEKEQLAEKEERRREVGDDSETPNPGELPPADFKALIGILASQAVMGLGSMADPKTGGVVVDLVGSKFAIDLLGVVQEKTTGNLDEQESAELEQVITELRSRFVQIAQIVASNPPQGTPGAKPDAGGAGSLEIPGT
jgi:hypothetical protein